MTPVSPPPSIEARMAEFDQLASAEKIASHGPLGDYLKATMAVRQFVRSLLTSAPVPTPTPSKYAAFTDDELVRALGNACADFALAERYEHNAHLRPPIREALLAIQAEQIRRRQPAPSPLLSEGAPTPDRCPWCDGEGALEKPGAPDVNGYPSMGQCVCGDGTLPGWASWAETRIRELQSGNSPSEEGATDQQVTSYVVLGDVPLGSGQPPVAVSLSNTADAMLSSQPLCPTCEEPKGGGEFCSNPFHSGAPSPGPTDTPEQCPFMADFILGKSKLHVPCVREAGPPLGHHLMWGDGWATGWKIVPSADSPRDPQPARFGEEPL